jgi:predicted AlkP superfamily pyrophosphatase or phosphodiesterase
MRRFKKNAVLSFFLGIVISFAGCSGHKSRTGEKIKGPRLVVGIVVDQMRYDYIYRYWNKFGNGGFKRLVKQGYLCANTNINYIPSYTGPGHAAIYTGTTPSVNGIIGNNWYDRIKKQSVYCVDDNGYFKAVGSAIKDEHGMSPRNLLTSTITDELKFSDNNKSKVIGISLKDRGSILPAGHNANAAYWLDDNGDWISSNYYMDTLPGWVSAFNNQKQAAGFLGKAWTTFLKDTAAYTESTGDNISIEKAFKGEEKPVFPHNLPQLKGKNNSLIRETPFGNTLTKNFAIETVKKEHLGESDFTDFLAISFSSTDYVGHRFGPNSIETEDTYIRLDKDLEELLIFLDGSVGNNEYLVFLTADHGAALNPQYLFNEENTRLNHAYPGHPAGYGDSVPRDHWACADHQGYFNSEGLKPALEPAPFANKSGQAELISKIENLQVYFNEEEVISRGLSMAEAEDHYASIIRKQPGVAEVITRHELETNNYDGSRYAFTQSGYNTSRSGDIAVILKPGWIECSDESKGKGTTHGSGYSYDTHIPLIFYGWNIKAGVSNKPVSITDIAPTLADLLQIQAPTGCTGKIIPGLLN